MINLDLPPLQGVLVLAANRGLAPPANFGLALRAKRRIARYFWI
jgi:hypothetical protein